MSYSSGAIYLSDTDIRKVLGLFVPAIHEQQKSRGFTPRLQKKSPSKEGYYG